MKCAFCDAGGYYAGRIPYSVMMYQIDYLVSRHFPDRRVGVEKFKIQFARVGEPSFNMDVVRVISALPDIYDAPGLMPCISTVAPCGTDEFFEVLLDLKKKKFPFNFQLQFSLHTTDERLRDKIIPVKKWGFDRIASYGSRFFNKGGRKITLNFAVSDEFELDPGKLLKYFDPDVFLIKLTPVNPTIMAVKGGFSSRKIFCDPDSIVSPLKGAGYDVVLSIGELEENRIGSNCGQYIMKFLREKESVKADSYSYDVEFFGALKV